ncbi:MAG: MATE family efflux transporter, partial [Spirochaetales bacterium]|nr:MATE family efflux transporter [Spirochaetales bacterium]
TAITASAIDPVVAMIGAKGSVAGPTKDYLLPLMISSIVIIGNFAVGIILRSEGAAMQAMTGMMVGTVVNIVLDPVMIFVFDMKIAGAAWATVIGNLAGLIYYLSCYFGKSIIKIKFTRNIFRLDYFREILSIGIPSGLNQALMSVAGIFLNNLAAGYGPVILAAMGVSQRLSSLIILLLIGLATGCQPLYGYNYGAKNKKRLISILKTSMTLGVGIGSVLLAVFTIFGKPAIAVFTSIPEVVAEGVFILRAMTIAAPIIGINMICMNSLQAFGKAMPSLIISAGRQGLFYIPLLFTLNALFGYHGLVFTQAIVEVLTAIAASLMLRHVLRTDEHLRA